MSITIQDLVGQSPGVFESESAILWPTYFKDHIAKDRYQEVISEQDITIGKVAQTILNGAFLAAFVLGLAAPSLYLAPELSYIVLGVGLAAGLAIGLFVDGSSENDLSFSSTITQSGKLYACLTEEDKNKYLLIRITGVAIMALGCSVLGCLQLYTGVAQAGPVAALGVVLGGFLGEMIREKVLDSSHKEKVLTKV